MSEFNVYSSLKFTKEFTKLIPSIINDREGEANFLYKTIDYLANNLPVLSLAKNTFIIKKPEAKKTAPKHKNSFIYDSSVFKHMHKSRNSLSSLSAHNEKTNNLIQSMRPKPKPKDSNSTLSDFDNMMKLGRAESFKTIKLRHLQPRSTKSFFNKNSPRAKFAEQTGVFTLAKSNSTVYSNKTASLSRTSKFADNKFYETCNFGIKQSKFLDKAMSIGNKSLSMVFREYKGSKVSIPDEIVKEAKHIQEDNTVAKQLQNAQSMTKKKKNRSLVISDQMTYKLGIGIVRMLHPPTKIDQIIEANNIEDKKSIILNTKHRKVTQLLYKTSLIKTNAASSITHYLNKSSLLQSNKRDDAM